MGYSSESLVQWVQLGRSMKSGTENEVEFLEKVLVVVAVMISAVVVEEVMDVAVALIVVAAKEVAVVMVKLKIA